MNSRSTKTALFWKSKRKKVVKVKIEDLAKLLGKTRGEVEGIVRDNEVIELNLSERKRRHIEEDDELRIYE